MFTAEQARDYVTKRLMATRRKGMKKLLAYMEEIGFFTAPASGGNHLCCEGGLAVHTANVMRLAEKAGKVFFGPEEFKNQRNSIRIVAGLHDLGKAGAWNKVYYAENMIKDGRPTKAQPEQRYKRSDVKPFEVNRGLVHIDHPMLSVKEADLYIELTEEEYFAILYHDGMYGSLAYYLKGHERPLQTLLHFADYWSAQFEEGKSLSVEEPAPDPEVEDLPFN